MKLYFFNSLYLLTNKTQMKMKKTQSLKLMLLGLMASAGMNAWAAVGDVFSDNTSCLFFEELDGGKARVVGVTNVVNGIVTIPDKTSNPFDNSNNPLSVTEVSNDWYGKSEIELRHYDGDGNLVKETTTQVKDLRQWPTPFKLIVDATQLKKINALALIPLNGKINGFEVTAQAGLEEIDDFSFANPGDVATLNDKAVQDYADAMLKAKEDAAKAKEELEYEIDDQPAIVNGKYNGKEEWADFDGQDVYVLKKFVNAENAWQDATDCTYIVLGKEIDGTRDKFGYKQREIWTISLADGSLTKASRTTARLHYQADGVTPSGDLCYCNADGTVLVLGVASKLTADNACTGVDATTLTSTPDDAVPGLQSQADDAGTLYSELLKARADFNAIKENPSTVSNDIKNRVPNGWVAAHLFVALSAAEDAMEEAIDELFKAYGTRTVGDDGVVPFTSTSPYAAWQNFPATSAVGAAVEQGLVDVNGVYDPDNRISVTYTDENGTSKTTELNEAQFNAAQRIMNVMDAAGYTRVNGGFPRPSFSNIRDRVITTTEAYEKLEEMSEDLIAYDNDKPAVESDGTPIKEIKEGTTFYYGSNQAEGLTLAQVIAAIPGARAASDAAKQALREAKQDLADAEDTIEALKNKDREDFVEEAALDPENYNHSYTAGVNTVLKTVDIEDAPKLKEIGESAFQNCKDAVFDGTSKLPVTIEKIEDNAFSGASKFAPDFTTLVNLKEIGNEAFANTATTDGDFADAKGLAKVGKDIFKNCAIQNLMLKGTPLTEIPVGLAQTIKRENAPFIDACGKYWNMTEEYMLTAAPDGLGLTQQQVDQLRDLGLIQWQMNDAGTAYIKKDGKYVPEEHPVNISLTVASLPAAITKIEKAKGSTAELGTFENCINLATLTGGIPVGVTEIGAKAFYGTKIEEFDLTLLDKLNYIGAGAFAGNSELTTVKLPEAAAYNETGLTELPAGVFECDGDLETVIINPEMQCLPEGLFAGSKIETLDLSNTQVTVIPNLFQATETAPNTTLKYVKLPDTQYAADNFTMLIPGVRVIGDNAFAHMHALIGSDNSITDAATNKFVVPSSVEAMGSGVFKDDAELVNVEFAGYSKLTQFGEEVFNSTKKLRTVKFLTLNLIDKREHKISRFNVDDLTGCNDMDGIISPAVFSFTEAKVFASSGRSQKVDVYVTAESLGSIVSDNGAGTAPGVEGTYIILHADPLTMTLGGPKKTSDDKDLYARTYVNENFGVWIPVNQTSGANVTVWTAYQDCDIIYAYNAKHNNGFYKIPAAGVIDREDYIKYPVAPYLPTDGVKPLYNDPTDPTSGARLLEDGFNYADDPFTGPNGTGTEIGEYTVPASVIEQFAKDTKKGTYIYDLEQKYAPRSAAVLITSDQADPVEYEIHSTDYYKYQSTLDYQNELKVLAREGKPTKDDDIYRFGASDAGKWGFFDQAGKTLPVGTIVFPLSGYQGTAYPDYDYTITAEGSRGIDVVFLNGNFTDINDVKKYVKSMKESGDIYDMRGMKVTAPVKGHMYIQNGAKFIQK